MKKLLLSTAVALGRALRSRFGGNHRHRRRAHPYGRRRRAKSSRALSSSATERSRPSARVRHVPAGARVIDAHGAVVTPGLIAADAGLAATEVGEDEDAAELGLDTAGPGDGTRDLSTQSKTLTAAFDVQYALNPDFDGHSAGATCRNHTRHRDAGIRVLAADAMRRRAKRCSPGRRPSSISVTARSLLVKPHAAMVVDLGEAGG